MTCILCGTEWEGETLPFSAVCEKCHCWLHSCVQCALWDSRAQICRSMTTDSIADRDGKNFCEEWIPGNKKINSKSDHDANGKFASLFGG